jgi:putative intracellular protease/amidase
VPFLVENELKALGGIYSRGPDWGSYVLQDGLLITGQNPGSSPATARALMDAMAILNAVKIAA